MAVPAEDHFFKQKKYPFILTLSILLICVTLFLVTTTTTTFNPLVFYSNVQHQHQPKPPLNPSSPIDSDSTTISKKQKLPSNEEDVVQKEEVVLGNVSIDWKVCKEHVTVDYIPCLDNYKAIQALKSRRHMEHRERHCPETSLNCLLPLPKGYKVPVHWPKSRDMVRLI